MNKNIPFVFLRSALALVVLYFAYMQLTAPEAWTSYIPAWTNSFIEPAMLVLLNGTSELLLGLLLLAGMFTRVVAGLLALHIFIIALDIGFTPTGMRDFGIAAALAYISATPNKNLV